MRAVGRMERCWLVRSLGCAVTAATPTGGELRAWRERRLGFGQKAWIEDALDETRYRARSKDGVVYAAMDTEKPSLANPAEGDGAYGCYEARIAVLRYRRRYLTAEEQRRQQPRC